MNSKYQYTDKCREISGFGGEYEETCRKMVIQGMEWLEKHVEADPVFKSNKHVFGLILNDNEDAKNLEEAIVCGFQGLSGAMVHGAINHVLAAKQLGWEKYIEEMEKTDSN